MMQELCIALVLCFPLGLYCLPLLDSRIKAHRWKAGLALVGFLALVLIVEPPAFAGTRENALHPSVRLTAQERAWLQSHPKVTVANELDWPPFDFAVQGEPRGLSIDLVRLVADKVGMTPQFVNGYNWAQLVGKFKAGEIDALPAVYLTPGRMKYMEFTKPYATNPSVLVVRDDRPDIRTLADLKGRTVAIVASFETADIIKARHPEIKRLPVKNVQEGLQAVAFRRADAFIGSLGVISHIMDAVVIPDIQIVGEVRLKTKAESELRMGVLAKDSILRDILQKGLDAVSRADMHALRQRWIPFSVASEGKTQSVALTHRERTWLQRHPGIRIGYNKDLAPFTFSDKDGRFAGIAAGYLHLLSERLGVDLSSAEGMTRAEAVRAIKEGRIAVIPAAIKTPDTERYLRFTKPYVALPIVVAVRSQGKYIDGLSGLKGMKVGVVDGSATHKALARDYPGLVLKPYGRLSEGLSALNKGEIDAFVGNLGGITYLRGRQKLGDIKIAALTEYRFDLSFGVRKDWPQLVGILDKALATVSQPERSAIKNSWMAIHVQYGVGFKRILTWAVPIAGMVVLLILFVVIWNRRLAGQVRLRQVAEERLKAMAANVPGAIFQFTVHKSGKAQFTYITKRAEEFFGVPPEVVIAEKRLLRFHPEDKDRAIGEINQALIHKRKINLVARIIMPDGETAWIRVTAAPTQVSDTETAFNGFILNITERKQAEAEFLASERKIKAMSQAVDDALVMIDGQGKVMFWNPAAERLFGYSTEEAMGMAFHDMAAPDQYRDKIGPGLKRFAETGEGPVLGTTTEITARDRHGNQFPVEVTLSSFQLEGQWYAVGTVRDISARKQAEQAIRDSERRMADIIDFLPDPALVIDADGKVLFWNRSMERLTGVSKQEMLGNGDYVYALPFYGERRPILVDLVRRWDDKLASEYFSVRKEGGCLVSESFHQHLGEKGLYLSGTAAVLYDDEGNEVGAIETLRDITERKRAEALMVEKEVAEDAAARAEQARKEAETAQRELRAKLEEIERFNRLALGREERIVELKREVNGLAELAGVEKPFEEHRLEPETRQEPDEAAAAAGPAVEMDADRLAAVLSVDQFQKLLQDFCDAAGVASAIIDTEGKVLAAARWQRVCTDFHRQNDITCGRCIESDTELATQLGEGKPYAIYRCKNGLTDAASPIMIDGQHLANTFVGQFFTTPPDEEFFRRQAREVGFDPEQYLAAVAEVPVVREERLPAILGFLAGMSRMVAASYSERLRASQAEEAMARRAEESQRQRAAALSLAEDAEKARAEIERYKGRLEQLVTERTEELKLSEERSRLLLHSAGEGIFGVDGEGRVSFINPAALAMLGYTEAEIMGQPVHGLVHHSRPDGSGYPIEECPMHASFTEGTTHQVDDEVLWRKDGGALSVEYFSTPISKEGRVVGAVITFRDVSERKAAEEELRRNLDELERFSRLVVGREEKMIALKEEINQLLEQAGHDRKYKIVDQESIQ